MLHSSCGCSKQKLAWSAQWKCGPLSEGKHWLKTRTDGPQRSSSSCSRAPTAIKHSKGHPTANRHTTRSSLSLCPPPANRQWPHRANEMERIVSDVNDQKRASVLFNVTFIWNRPRGESPTGFDICSRIHQCHIHLIFLTNNEASLNVKQKHTLIKSHRNHFLVIFLTLKVWSKNTTKVS